MRVPTTTAPGPVATSRSGTRQQGPVGAESNRNWTNNLGPSTAERSRGPMLFMGVLLELATLVDGLLPENHSPKAIA